MAESRKVLGQAIPGAGSLAALYTVPSGVSAVASSIVICNHAGADVWRVSVAIAGALDAPQQYMYYDVTIPANDTFIATLGMTLGSGDVVRCRSASGNLSFILFGVEVS